MIVRLLCDRNKVLILDLGISVDLVTPGSVLIDVLSENFNLAAGWSQDIIKTLPNCGLWKSTVTITDVHFDVQCTGGVLRLVGVYRPAPSPLPRSLTRSPRFQDSNPTTPLTAPETPWSFLGMSTVQFILTCAGVLVLLISIIICLACCCDKQFIVVVLAVLAAQVRGEAALGICSRPIMMTAVRHGKTACFFCSM
jgi:hypothetical protein